MGFRMKNKNEFWKVRDNVIQMQRWLDGCTPKDDSDIRTLVIQLAQARATLERLAFRLDDQNA